MIIVLISFSHAPRVVRFAEARPGHHLGATSSLGRALEERARVIVEVPNMNTRSSLRPLR